MVSVAAVAVVVDPPAMEPAGLVLVDIHVITGHVIYVRLSSLDLQVT